MSATAYPLDWPPGWKRTQVRTRAKFVGKAGKHVLGENGAMGHWETKRELTIEQATRRVLDELKRFGVGDWNIIISTNLQLRQDGLPRFGQANPRDPGAAVYWTKGKEGQRCMAIDRYDRVADNLAAIAATLDAMRAIERHGGAAILDRAYKRLAAEHHPDRGGDEQKMARINSARDQLLDQ